MEINDYKEVSLSDATLSNYPKKYACAQKIYTAMTGKYNLKLFSTFKICQINSGLNLVNCNKNEYGEVFQYSIFSVFLFLGKQTPLNIQFY